MHFNILESVNKIQQYSSGFVNSDDFYRDSVSFDATMMNFVIIGEVGSKLSDEFKSETKHLVDWQKVKGFRNIKAHDYFGIDTEEIWQIINSSLITLKDTLGKLSK